MWGREKAALPMPTPTLRRRVLISSPQAPPDRATKNAIGILKELALSIGCKGLQSPRRNSTTGLSPSRPSCPTCSRELTSNPRSALEHHGFYGSYRDVSRVATVDERLWAQLFIFNSDNICAEIDTLIANLKAAGHNSLQGLASGLTNPARGPLEKGKCCRLKRITVNTARAYDILISGGLDKAGELSRKVNGGPKALIITDSNVATFTAAGQPTRTVAQAMTPIFWCSPAGEQSKSSIPSSPLRPVLQKKRAHKKRTCW